MASGPELYNVEFIDPSGNVVLDNNNQPVVAKGGVASVDEVVEEVGHLGQEVAPVILPVYTQHSQLCSLCTLGDKSQWTMVYYVTLIVAWFVYIFKSILDMTRNSPLSDGLSINVVVSCVAWIVAVVVMPDASADDSDCQKFGFGQKHENASFLLISMCLGYFSLISSVYSPKNSTTSYLSISVFTIFCLIFLIFAAASKNKSLHQCNKVNFKNAYISSSTSSTSSIEQDCMANIVTTCNKSQTSRCRNQMHKNNHKAFSIKYLATNNTSWSFLENKPNWKDITTEMSDVLYTFYTTPFQIRLSSGHALSSTQHYLKAYSFVEWESTPIPADKKDLAASVSDDTKVTALIKKLNENGGFVIHNDVKELFTSLNDPNEPKYAGKWHQKEIYYTPIDIGDNDYILQRVSSIPLNTSLDTTDLNSYITAHHIHITSKTLKTQALINSENSPKFIPLHGMNDPPNYDNQTELAVIQNMKQVFETNNSYVELTLGNQSVYLTPTERSKRTMITCSTYDKTPTAADIEPLAETATQTSPPQEGLGFGPGGPGAQSGGTGGQQTSSGSGSSQSTTDTTDTDCRNINNQSIYYEAESKSGPDRRFLLNASITSLFAAIAFLRLSVLKRTNGELHVNVFSFIAICHMFMFFYVSTGFSSTARGDEYFWSAVFSLFLTFCTFAWYQRKNGKPWDASLIKTMSALFSVLFNVFLLCHLIVQLSSGTPTNTTYGTERESPWYIPALVSLFIFLLLPFDEESLLPEQSVRSLLDNSSYKEGGKSYIAKVFNTGPTRLMILLLFIICTTFFSNNYFDIPRNVRLIFVIILSITLGLLTFPKYDAIFKDDSPHLSDHKTSTVVIILLSFFFSINNFSQSFSNYATESVNHSDADKTNLYNATSALLVGLVSLITAQLIFGKKAFYPLAIMCVIPFLTLYQYEVVKEQAPSDVCDVKVTFGQADSNMLYNSKTCGDGSIVRPDNDCQFSTRMVHSVKMLDKNNHCQVMLHENVGENSGKTVWELKHNDLKFTENCSDEPATAGINNSCLKILPTNTNASAITVLQRCALRLYPASNSIDPKTQKPREIGFHLRIKQGSLGVKVLELENDFEVWPPDVNNQPPLSAWKNYKFERIEVVGSGYKVLGFEKITFEGSRHEFALGTNPISPPKSFNSFVIEKDTNPMWPEVLPFIISNTNSEYVNILWRVIF